MSLRRLLLLVGYGCIACAVGPSLASPRSRAIYTISKSVPIGAPDRWDLLTFDESSHRVYIAHGDKVTVIDGESGTLVGEVEGFPVENAAIGAGSRAGCRPFEGDSCFAEFLGEGIEVAGVRGPADEFRLGEESQAESILCAGLVRIGRDDFEIPPLAEGKQRVARAATGMDSADGGADTDAVLDKGDAGVEIVAAEKNVVEQGGYLFIFIAEGDWRRDERGAREREEQSARNGVRHGRLLQRLMVALFWPRLER